MRRTRRRYLSGTPQENTENAIDRLNISNRNLDRAASRLAASDCKGAISNLKEAAEDLGMARGYMESGVASSEYERKIDAVRDRGLDVRSAIAGKCSIGGGSTSDTTTYLAIFAIAAALGAVVTLKLKNP